MLEHIKNNGLRPITRIAQIKDNYKQYKSIDIMKNIQRFGRFELICFLPDRALYNSTTDDTTNENHKQ